MASIKDIYKLAIDNGVLDKNVQEQQFNDLLKDENTRRQYWEYCNTNFPNFYSRDFETFSANIQKAQEADSLASIPVQERSSVASVEDSLPMQPMKLNPSVKDHPAPTNEQEYMQNLINQITSGEEQMPTSTTQPTKQEEDWADRFMNKWENVEQVPIVGELADMGKTAVAGVTAGTSRLIGGGTLNTAAMMMDNPIKVDAMGQPQYIPMGQSRKMNEIQAEQRLSYEDQLAAANRVAQAKKEGKEPDATDLRNSTFVRAANSVNDFADKMSKIARPADIAEDDTFIDLVSRGELLNAAQLALGSTAESLPYMASNLIPGGALLTTVLSASNEYANLTQESPEMDKWKKYASAILTAGTEQAIERFGNPFKGLKGANKKAIGEALEEIREAAGTAIWKRLAKEIGKSTGEEGLEEVATSALTDIFNTMLDVDGTEGKGLRSQYEKYVAEVQKANPDIYLNEKSLMKGFVKGKVKEYLESFSMGALGGLYISSISSAATAKSAKEEQNHNKRVLTAIGEVKKNHTDKSEEELANLFTSEKKEYTDEEKVLIKEFNEAYKNAYKIDARNEIYAEIDKEAEQFTNKTNQYIYEVTMADGSLEDGDTAYIVDGNVGIVEVEDGKKIIDTTNSDEWVSIRVIKADGTSQVKQVSTQELNLAQDPVTKMEWVEAATNTAMASIEAQAQATQDVVGEGNATNLKAEGEQASNIEGRQFTNGQQTITASNPDSNGNVTLSSPITLEDGRVATIIPQDMLGGVMSAMGFAEQGNPQPQGQQPQAPVVWSEMDAEQATATVVERSKGDKARAKKFAEAQVKVKQKALTDAQKELDKVAESGDIGAFNAAQDKVDAIQAEVDKWTAVANGIDAYNAPIQVAPQPTPSATSASGNGVVTEGTARQSTTNQQQSANNSQNTLQNENNSVTLQTEKSAAQKVIDKIDGGQYKTLVFNDENIEQQMRDAGLGEESIAEVLETIKIFGVGAIDGFYENGVVFVYEKQSEDKVRSKYVHERQHGLNDEKGNRKRDVVNASTESQLKRVVRRMAGNDFYDRYNHLAVADEFICRAMEIAYSVDTDAELEAELRKYGANEQLIQIIKDLNNEQRKDTNLGKARKSSYVVESSNESSREGERDSEEISSRVLGHEGSRPTQTSESRDRSGRSSEVTQDTALEESGIQVNEETGDARFSVNYRLDANQMDILAEQIAERVGVSKTKAKKWLKAETSLAALCMQEDNVAALYYFADGRYGAIKNNSDYPQGTVDFNNICRKRLDFTNIYLSLQREFPNKVFTAKDLETIRQIMIEDGLEVACGLCYVEDRRQLLGEIANEFRGFLKDRTIPEDLSATKKEVMQKVLDMVGDDTYIPTIAQLLEAGAYELRNSHPNIFEAFVVFNNSRGMQSGRLFEGYAEYKREILDWSDKKVKQVNDAGGLRIFSFSDFEAHHLIDIVQIISDAASKGVMIQGYTKVPEFARAIRNTKVKLNRSLIPLGDTGIQEVDGKKVLAYDTTEGIDVNSENFLDESNNPNVGNVLVGINDEQIRMAMEDANVDYIIPFHTGLKKDILLQKKIGAWVNYKNSQTEKDATTGSSKTADGKKVVGVNIYTDVLQAAEKEGTPIKNRKEFVEYFLKVCKERGLVPRFEQFLARGKNGEYKYTKGYEKLLVDFKMFDKRGNILPQEPVVPIFDDAFNQQIIEDYVKGTKETKEYEGTKDKIRKELNLVKFSIGNNSNTDYLNSKQEKNGQDIVGEVESTDTRFSVSKNNRKTIENWLSKRNDLTEQEKNAFWIYIEEEEPMKQLAMGKWMANGAIRLPEDQPTVDDAIKHAKKMKVDPLSYAAPAEITNEYRERFGKEVEKTQEELLSPDDARFEGILTNKVDYGNGLVVYDVQNDKVGQDAVRELMNDHLGKNFNCWCLLYSDANGNVTGNARSYWKSYNGTQKKVAFCNGKICAFCASHQSTSQWWDLNDMSNGELIPMDSTIPNDELGRSAKGKFDTKTKTFYRSDNVLYRGNRKNGLYEEWYNDDPHSLSYRGKYKGGKQEGVHYTWRIDGSMASMFTFEKGIRKGRGKQWNNKGILIEDGIYRGFVLTNGIKRDDNGNIQGIITKHIEKQYKDGEAISLRVSEGGQQYAYSGEGGEVNVFRDDSNNIYFSHTNIADSDSVNYRVRLDDARIDKGEISGDEEGFVFEINGKEYQVKLFKRGAISRIMQTGFDGKEGWQLDFSSRGQMVEAIYYEKGKKLSLPFAYYGQTEFSEREIESLRGKSSPLAIRLIGEYDAILEALNISRSIALGIRDLIKADINGWLKNHLPNVEATMEYVQQKAEKYKAEEEELLKNQTPRFSISEDAESQVRFSVVTDKKKIEELEASEKMKGYRTVILNEDGTFSSPMATGLGNKGKASTKTSGFELGKWEQAEERPELADENGKINLKPKKGGDTYVDYNPYIHNRLDKINTQFTSAWRKPFLVYIETEIPMSDIESGYHAEKAALSVGVHTWNGGDLVLSRYDKPVRIVPWEEVADAWAEQFDEVTFDIVNPELLPLLHERGVKILPPKKAAKEKALAAYKKWEAENSNPRFSITFVSVNEELNADGISIDNDVLMKEYGLSSIELSKKDNYIKLAKIVVEDKGKGNGSRFMEDLTKYADANGYTLTLTPNTSFGASSVARLKKFYKEFGFKDNKGRNTDYNVWESMLRTPKSPRFSITAAEDKAYADAVARGDMETAQDMLRDAAERAGYAPSGDYKDMHQAPSATVEKEDFTNIEALQEQLDNGNVDSNLFAIAQGVTAAPQDYFSPQGARWYGYGNLSGMESYFAINNAIRSINAQLREYGEVRDMPKVKVYRAVPKNIKGAQLESEGQWVSPSREYAVGHGRHRFGFNQYRIIEQEVPADQLWWDANDIREWGFDDGTVNAYQNTKNNRKLYEVTYDDNGELIPLSKRFDKRKADVRFSVTAQEDAAYMEAVNRGDMETAQRMVNEAAKNAGYTIRAYHGTDSEFTEFDSEMIGDNTDSGFYGRGFYFATTKNEASYYGGNTLNVFLKFNNPLDLNQVYKVSKRWDAEDVDGNVRYWYGLETLFPNSEISDVAYAANGYGESWTIRELKERIDELSKTSKTPFADAIEEFGIDEDLYDSLDQEDLNLPNELTNTLEENGYDGIINAGVDNNEIVAFYPNQIKSADPVTYDDNGNVIPLSERFNDDKKDIRFSVSNINQRIFVSNAERAVESIKQEKATPQQWKAMIEKQGGLKAGEDKWLGLSEWLDSKVAPMQEGETKGDAARRVAKNTITKQEILDYIAEHQIQIEEVEYAEGSPFEGELTMEQEGNFNGFILEWEDIITGEGVSEEEAFETMVERYGDDFRMAFELDESNDFTYIVDYDGRLSDAAQHFLGEDNPNQINDTRLQYTTKGLENKKEIALTVPTVESWNENDEIHFGDAGGGRAIAWIRFGETQMQTPREVVDHVDELQFAFTNVYGREVYAPQGSKFSKDYAVYGKLANGEMGYVLYVRDKQLSAHPTLEAALAALNAHYEANPRQVTEYSDVLVIDEIQSKRHQEGREKGYITKEGREIKKKIKELTDRQDAIYSTNRWSRTEDMLSSNEEAAEYRRLEEEIVKLQEELPTKTGIIPDAPFDKNWHELAFKRMLRYAAENGYDYVAWTTGEQQAERYNLGKQFDSIEREDNPSINGRRFALNGANYFTFVVNEEGVITESDMSEIQGKPLADVVGKDLAIRMMSLEDGDAIEGADLRIGGEGMKGFYDKMLPSFVSKYTKKWGAKVQDINLPNLEESAQTMHAVNVTQEMKDSVKEGQVMFSVRNTAENLQMSPESSTFAEQYRWGDTMFDEDYISNAYSKEMDAFYDAVLTIENPLNEAERNEAYIKKAKAVEEFLLKLNFSNKMYVISSFENMQDELENAGVAQDVIDLVIETEKELREIGKKSWGLKYNDQVFIFSEPMESLVDAQLTYAHELQHIENEKNKQLLADITNVTSPQELNDILLALGKAGYSHYLQEGADGFIGLADEVVAYMMEYGYSLGKDGNLADALKRDGLQNVELINLLQQEYERRKEDSPFVLNKNQRSNGMRSNNGDGTSNDEADLRRRPIKVGEFKFGGFASRSMPQTKGELARRIVEQRDLQNLREEVANKLLSTSEVQFEDFVLEDDAFAPRFSITDAPAPTPTETKREYLKRYMAWLDAQRDSKVVEAYKKELKKGTKFWRQFIKKIVDRNIAIGKFQDFVLKQGGKIKLDTNAFLDTTMAIGRAGSASRRYDTRYAQPMYDAIAAIVRSGKLKHIDIRWEGIDGKMNGKRLTPSEIVGVYCQAKDVQEAKEMGLPDRGEEGFKNNLRGYGETALSYEDIIDMVEGALQGTDMIETLWRAVNNATFFSLIYQHQWGYIDHKTFNEYRSRKYYVPERGWRERDLEDRDRKYVDSKGNEGNISSPFNSALAKAKGRTSLASDPFAYIVSIAHSSIAAVEKNNVKVKFLDFLLDNEEIGLESGAWTIKTVYIRKTYDEKGKEIGKVATYEKPSNPDDVVEKVGNNLETLKELTKGEKNQHAVVVIKEGKEYVILLEDEQLANALNRNYAGINFQNSPLGRILRGATGYYSGQLTQYNPEFAVTNLIKDYFLSQISNFAVQDKPFQHFARFNYNLARIIPELVTYVGANSIGKEAFLKTKKGKFMQEYFALGAQTGFSYLEDVSALRDKINKIVNANKTLKRATAVPKFLFMDMLSALTEFSELSIRMTQYITCRENGMSAKEAAIEAKEITVNFDRKGELSSVFSGLWSFFNASVQGTNKIARDIKRKPLRASLTYGGTAAVLFLLGYVWTMAHPDDPEEEEFWSDYARRTNFTIGEWKVPMAHFFRMFWGGGVTMALKEQGRITDTQAAGEMATMVMDEIIPSSPFQVQNLFEYNKETNEYDFSLGGYARNLAPSTFMPIIDVATNEDFIGRKIAKEPFLTSDEGKYKAKKYERANSTNEKYTKIADWLSGGDPNVLAKGVDDGNPIDINGTQLQYLVEGYTKQFSTLVDAYNLVAKAIKDEDIQTKDIPFLRKFRKDYLNDSAYKQEYWTLFNYMDQYKAQRKDAGRDYSPEKEDAYQDLKGLLNKKPEEGKQYSAEDIKKLMEANKRWRSVM